MPPGPSWHARPFCLLFGWSFQHAPLIGAMPQYCCRAGTPSIPYSTQGQYKMFINRCLHSLSNLRGYLMQYPLNLQSVPPDQFARAVLWLIVSCYITWMRLKGPLRWLS